MKYVIDIDGTICDKSEDMWHDGDYSHSVPKKDRIIEINKLYDDGHEITYLTARGMGRHKNSSTLAHKEFYNLTFNQLIQWGCKFHALHLGKPAGDLYIDDKGINANDFFTK
jgi:hypothetical protein|tara:strand:+ start:4261 stop:4596 length:336 start_codon:yes stop_codon:yes gene_type:complete